MTEWNADARGRRNEFHTRRIWLHEIKTLIKPANATLPYISASCGRACIASIQGENLTKWGNIGPRRRGTDVAKYLERVRNFHLLVREESNDVVDNLCDSISAVVSRTSIQLHVGRIHTFVSGPGADHLDN